MKKILDFLGLIISLVIIGLIVIIIFNPAQLRDKLIASTLNSYLILQIDDYKIVPEEERVSFEEANFDHPLIPNKQEEALHNMGVDVVSLPSEITPEMSACFIEKLGEARTNEIVNGATPSAIDLLKAKDCL
ncbi:MAG: hypothetical protein HOE19_03165 [Candidatus Komeilibacteria bacterium]|jgi:hypothetical protein|nr:hypothetical protein [Candidatus Komeilibacteria bacterium]MBT4447677.1 hypothetical protein [Candidatus Komeilibacteria bacterium]